MEIVINETNKIESNPFTDIFALKFTLPINFVQCAKPPSLYDLQNTDRLNNTLLDIILASVEPVHEPEESDEVLLRQLRLTDAKIELTLTWLSRLIANQNSIPLPKSIELNTIGIRFESEQSINMNDLLQLQLYIDPQLAEPIKLQSYVVFIEGKTITANFCEMDLEVKEKLDKYIFREHRRCIVAEKQRKSVIPA